MKRIMSVLTNHLCSLLNFLFLNTKARNLKDYETFQEVDKG